VPGRARPRARRHCSDMAPGVAAALAALLAATEEIPVAPGRAARRRRGKRHGPGPLLEAARGPWSACPLDRAAAGEDPVPRPVAGLCCGPTGRAGNGRAGRGLAAAEAIRPAAGNRAGPPDYGPRASRPPTNAIRGRAGQPGQTGPAWSGDPHPKGTRPVPRRPRLVTPNYARGGRRHRSAKLSRATSLLRSAAAAARQLSTGMARRMAVACNAR